MKLTIDRAKWGRGLMRDENGAVSQSSMLVGEESSNGNNDAIGKMCCLGFLALRCGFKREDLRDKCMPKDVDNALFPKRNRIPWLTMLDDQSKFTPDSQLALDLARINDDTAISDKMREYRIARKLKTIGVEVTFIN